FMLKPMYAIYICILRRKYRVKEFKNQYKALIEENLNKYNKTDILKKCENYTEEVKRKDLLPEDIVEIHKNYVKALDLNDEQISKTFNILKEVVKGFGYNYRDYQRLVDRLQ